VAEVIEIEPIVVPVFETVRLVGVPVLNAVVPDPLRVIEEPAKSIDLVPVPEDENKPAVTAYPARFTAPAVNVRSLVVAAPRFRAPTRLNVPPAPLNVTLPLKATPFVVIVFVPDVAANVLFPDVMVIPVEMVRSPYMVCVPFVAAAYPVKFIFLYDPEIVRGYVPVVTFKSGAVLSVAT
jgi:hypothetical protein